MGFMKVRDRMEEISIRGQEDRRKILSRSKNTIIRSTFFWSSSDIENLMSHAA